MQAWEVLTVHSHEAVDRGQDMHMQAAPSQAEALMRSFKSKKAALDTRSKASVLAAYGSAADASQEGDEARALAQTDSYVEYNAQGRVIKGQVQQVRRWSHICGGVRNVGGCCVHANGRCPTASMAATAMQQRSAGEKGDYGDTFGRVWFMNVPTNYGHISAWTCLWD